MYYAERDNPDPEMRYYYYSIPDAMDDFVESFRRVTTVPFHYMGKIITGVIGVFAVGLFGIPIGILGAGEDQLMGKTKK